jgi:hypothetical protein
MNTKQLEHKHPSGGANPRRKYGSLDFALVLVGLAAGWALLIGYPEPQAQQIRDVAISQAVPAQTLALALNAVEEQSTVQVFKDIKAMLPPLSPDAKIEELPPTF